MKRNRLRGFGHLERREKEGIYVEELHGYEGGVQGHEGGQERPGVEVVKNDMKGLDLASSDALDRHA